jgi:hypothetical protein
MIASTSTSIYLFLDQRAKRAVEGAFSAASIITNERVRRASTAPEKSPFQNCDGAGFDLQTEAERNETAP